MLRAQAFRSCKPMKTHKQRLSKQLDHYKESRKICKHISQKRGLSLRKPSFECESERLSSHLVLFKTSTAVNRSVAFRNERYLGFHPTARTSDLGKAWTMSIFLSSAAVWAALWRLEAFFSEELLFFSREIKVVATILASELLSIHVYERVNMKI